MNHRKLLDAYFEKHADEMLRDIQTLVRMPSLKAPPQDGAPFGMALAAVLDKALSIGREKGFLVKNFKNYVGTINFNEAETKLGILAHLDVMPEGAGWHYPAFDMTVDGERIYGRGVADDKGPAVAALYAMCAVKEICPELPYNVRLILGTDEESGSADIAYYFPIEPAPPAVFTPDSDFPLINTEKGRFATSFAANWEKGDFPRQVIEVHGADRHNVVPREASAIVSGVDAADISTVLKKAEAQTGVHFSARSEGQRTTVSAIGESAHGARPENGNNALTALLMVLSDLPLSDSRSASVIRGLHAMYPHGDTTGKALGIACEDHISGALSMNFSMFDLNETGFCARFDCRTPVEADQNAIYQRIEQAVQKFGAHVTNKAMVPPHHVPQDSPFVQTLLRIYHEYTGNEPYCLSIGGGTYVHNIDGGVAYGCAMPGVDNRMHGADEFSIIADLILSAKIFAQAILDLCGAENNEKQI